MFDLHRAKWWAPGASCQSCGKSFGQIHSVEYVGENDAYVLTRKDDSTGFVDCILLCRDCLGNLKEQIDALIEEETLQRLRDQAYKKIDKEKEPKRFFENLPVGETFEVLGKTLEVKDNTGYSGCTGCYFFYRGAARTPGTSCTDLIVKGLLPLCAGSSREDHKEIIFVEVMHTLKENKEDNNDD